jgi:HAD superfamily hydrolase (TIGR01509 family)
MTNRLETPPSRRLACARCGTEFTCAPSGPCWCADEIFLLPMPSDGIDCLCPDCLRQAAKQAASGDEMMGQWNVSAVLLDMDGTLLDTEKVYFDSLIAALNSRGYIDDVIPLCRAMVGLPGPECEALLIERYGEDFPLADISKAFVANRDEILRAGLPLKRGALELLDALQASECPMAIVTSSSRRTADQHLGLAGIRTRFETVLTREDVTRCKPSPDLYLLAATRLGVKPKLCVAVEDSNHGVAAAHAAGAITIMVPDMVPPTEETRAKCAAVLPDLDAVRTMLRTRAGLGH